MINYTERLSTLIEDIVARVPTLSFIDVKRTLVFARAGRSEAEGAYATCHCVSLPPTDPGYYFWRDRGTGHLTRRSEWFVTRSPVVKIGPATIDYMLSFTLPRFCDQSLARSKKGQHYDGEPNWVGKLDTVVHELYHIDPGAPGIRRMEKGDGTYSANCHGQRFFENVVGMVKQYLATKPDPEVYDFLQYGFADLTARFGGLVGTTFRSFPSYPQRYVEALQPQPPGPKGVHCRIDPVKAPRVITRFTEDDLVMREFTASGSRRVIRTGKYRAA
jgi:hypothetical protein